METFVRRGSLLILTEDARLRVELETMLPDCDVNCSEISPDALLFDFSAATTGGLRAQAFELLGSILNLAPRTKVIAMTEPNRRDLAAQAVGLGATDFYHKPVDATVLPFVVRRAFRIRELEIENERLRE